jgi:hypothetical protein
LFVTLLLGAAPGLAQAQRPVPAAVVRVPVMFGQSEVGHEVPQLKSFVVVSANPPRFLPIGTVAGVVVGGALGLLIDGHTTDILTGQ